MELINLTGHTVKLITPTTEHVFKSRGRARVDYSFMFLEELSERFRIPIHKAVYEICGLPKESQNTLYLVSSVVYNSSSRTDLVLPYGILRNEDNVPYGCLKLLHKGE